MCTSFSLKVIGHLYGMSGRSVKIAASLSFDLRKFLFLFTISAVYAMYGEYVVTSGIRLVVDFSLIFRHCSCVNSSTFSISVHFVDRIHRL